MEVVIGKTVIKVSKTDLVDIITEKVSDELYDNDVTFDEDEVETAVRKELDKQGLVGITITINND